MNAKSYDKRMEKLPLFISYPRSGSHWVNSILEIYFNRPRLRAGPCTFLPDRDSRTDYMWFHDHDIFSDLKVKHNNIFFLYRNPIDVTYSLLKAEEKEITEDKVIKQVNLIKNHWQKYLVNGTAKLIIKYENLKKHSYDGFERITSFLEPNHILDKKKLNDCLAIVTKENVEKKQTDKRYFNKHMLTKEYDLQRKDFDSKYHDLFDIFSQGELSKF